MKKIMGILFLGLFSLSASAGQIYTTYTGSQNGVTVRDADTLVQSFAFSLGFAVDNISAGSNNDMFLTSGDSIYHYSDAGEQLNSFTWGNPRLSYDGIAVSGEDFFTAYSGSQNGVTVRNSNNLAQRNFFDPGFATDNIAAGNGNEMYLTSGNSIYRYDDNGVQLAQMAFPDPRINYQGISMASLGNSIYAAYTGAQNGVTIRDSANLAQSFFFDPGFTVDNLVAGGNSDMYLTSGNSIYHYSEAGVQLNQFSWSDTSIQYQGIAHAVPEPAALMCFLLGLAGLGLKRINASRI